MIVYMKPAMAQFLRAHGNLFVAFFMLLSAAAVFGSAYLFLRMGFRFFRFAGIALILAGLLMAAARLRYFGRSKVTEGRIVAYHSQADGQVHTTYYYYPEIEFRLPSGERIRFVSRSGEGPKRSHTETLGDQSESAIDNRMPAVGVSVSVRYNVQNPKNAEINSFFTLCFGTLVLLLFGIAAILLGLLPLGPILR